MTFAGEDVEGSEYRDDLFIVPQFSSRDRQEWGLRIASGLSVGVE